MGKFDFKGHQTHTITYTWVDRTNASYPASFSTDEQAISAAKREATEMRCEPCRIKAQRFRGAVIYNESKY